MPNLPGSSRDKDAAMFTRVLRDPALQADQWKIYPTQVTWPARARGLPAPVACPRPWPARARGLPVPVACPRPWPDQGKLYPAPAGGAVVGG